MLGWANILGALVGLYSPSIGVWFNLLRDYPGIGIADKPVGLWLGSELGSPLGALLDSETWIPVVLQLILGIPPGSKVRYPDLVGSTLQATAVVPPSGSCPNFTSRTCLKYTLQSTLAVTLSRAWPTLPRRHGHFWNLIESKGDNRV